MVKDGKITQTGTLTELEPLLDIEDVMIDLGGKPVIPGMTDCHIHLLAYATTKERNVNLKGISSLEELQKKADLFIREKKIRNGNWLSGWGWNHDLFPDRKMPDRHCLDEISTKHPIKLTRMCYHICAVNSLALEAAGITGNTADPEGGHIDRDAGGRPTGVLRETAMALVDRVIPPLNDKEEIKELILSACADLVSCGFTTVHADDFYAVGDREKLLDAYRELDQADLLPLDINLQMLVGKPEDIDFLMEQGLRTGTRFKRLSAGPVKILGDGSLGSRTAALQAPYSDDPGTSGFMLATAEHFEKIAHRAFSNGFDVTMHAIGDLTMETALAAYEKYSDLIREKGLRPSIIHCQIASPAILEKFREQGVIANFQPIFIHSDWPIAGERVGSERLKTSYCWKTFLNKGIKCVGSSDAPVENFNPFWNIYAAVARKDLDGNPAVGWVIEEALNREEALKLFTLHPPLLAGETGWKGQLKSGYSADFAVLSDHLYEVPEEGIRHIYVLATYKEGRKVYEF